VNKIWLCIIFIGPDNTLYTSKPNRGLYTVLQYLVQSKGVLSNETTSERCSWVLNVNAQVTLDTSSRLFEQYCLSRLSGWDSSRDCPVCLPSLTFYSLSFARLRNQHWRDLSWATGRGKRWLTRVDQVATRGAFTQVRVRSLAFYLCGPNTKGCMYWDHSIYDMPHKFLIKWGN